MTRILIALLFFLISAECRAQSLPPGTCGVVYGYDAAGNRTQRQYICNNNVGRMAYATVPNQLDSMPVKQVSVIYPNPTTGHCKILFTKPLQNAPITITDMAGRVVYHINSSGTEVLFDLSHVKAGMYLIRIKDGNNSIVQKLIKQ